MKEFDVIVIGAGPAGISAAIYALRGGKRVAVIYKDGGALENAGKIGNYYGVGEIGGKELFERGLSQARSLGAELIETEATGIAFDGEFIITCKGEKFGAKAVILACGAKREQPQIGNLEQFEGKGVSYCAVCDGFFYRNKPAAVVGNGEYALEEAKNLAHAIILTDGKEPEADFSGYVVFMNKIDRFEGEERLEKVVFAEGNTLTIDGVFIAVGTAGSAELAQKAGAVIEGNYVVTDENNATNVPGLFAAGDCTKGLKQVSTAVADGARAGAAALKFLKSLK